MIRMLTTQPCPSYRSSDNSSQPEKRYAFAIGHPLASWAMVRGERIQELLDRREMSQSELARRVSLRQSTINELIHGGSRGSSHIHRIARELGTTPAYLMGETDDPEGEPVEDELTSEERRLLEIFRQLPKKDKAALRTLVDRMAQPDDN